MATVRELAIPIPHEEIAAFCRKWGIKRLSFFGSIWVDDKDVNDLQRALAEPNDSNGWKVYAEPQPPQSVINEFLAEVNG